MVPTGRRRREKGSWIHVGQRARTRGVPGSSATRARIRFSLVLPARKFHSHTQPRNMASSHETQQATIQLHRGCETRNQGKSLDA